MAFLRPVIQLSIARKYGLSSNSLKVLELSAANHLRTINQCRYNSQQTCESTANLSSVDNKSDVKALNPPRRDPLDTSFANPEASFKSKTTWELVRAYLVYTTCSFETIVENNMTVSSIY